MNHGNEMNHDAHGGGSLNRLAALATLHCLTGCAIGEVLGMVIGTALGWSNAATIAAAVFLAFVFGYSLTMLPLLRGGLPLAVALPLAFASDSFSIAVMELVDNGVMLAVPGAMDAPLSNPLFWGALAFALAVAYVFAFPLNLYLIARGQGHAVVHEYHGHHDGAGSAEQSMIASRRKLIVLGLASMAATIAIATGGALFVESRHEDEDAPMEEHAASSGHGGGEAAELTAAEAARELAFVRGEASETDIYVVREDGRGVRRLTRSRGADYSPIWSPDGKLVLFVSSRDGDDELFVMDAAGRNVRRLTRNRSQDLTPQWSPDGRLIAFASDRGRAGQPEIWVMRADGGSARRLVATADRPWQDAQYSPVWSQDGRRLIFSMTVAESNPELYVVGVDGKGLERLTRTAGSVDVLGDDTMPDWSNDGKTVVFVSNREQRSSDVWAMNANGSRQRPVVRRPAADDWNPRLSPDGSTIAFTERLLSNGRASVWLMDRDGSDARRLLAGAEPDWRPAR